MIPTYIYSKDFLCRGYIYSVFQRLFSFAYLLQAFYIYLSDAKMRCFGFMDLLVTFSKPTAVVGVLIIFLVSLAYQGFGPIGLTGSTPARMITTSDNTTPGQATTLGYHRGSASKSGNGNSATTPGQDSHSLQCRVPQYVHC